MTCIRLALGFSLAAFAQESGNVNHGAGVLKDFTDRVAAYMKIHKAAQSQVQRLKPTDSAAAIQDYELRLAEAIREHRRDAAPGQIFTPEITREFRRLIGLTMHGPQAARIRESLKSAAPVGKLVLRVNEAYPAALPLQSTPPSLLLNLPPLPKEMEYRVAGHDLVLRDADANLIVDFLLNVFV
jgi:hypothetical protein